MKERFGIHSIFVKQLICFALGNAIIVLVMTAIFLNAFQLAREEVYDRMNAQSEYYLETLLSWKIFIIWKLISFMTGGLFF